MNAQDGRDRHDRLRALTADAARRSDGPPVHRKDGEDGAPVAGALYVLPATADFPLEWLLLDRDDEHSGGWLAVPADTNPLRGPGDVWIGPGAPAGPLCLRCRFGVRLPEAALATGHRTGQVTSEVLADALDTLRSHEQGTLDPGPLARETAADPEYQDWEDSVLAPAVETVAELERRARDTAPAERSAHPATRSWIGLAATLALLSLGLGIWNLALHREVTRLSTPVLIGGSQELIVGDGPRAPVTLRIRPSDRHLLIFVVLEGDTADHDRYQVELLDRHGTVTWTSPIVEPGAVPELNLVIPRDLFDGPVAPTSLAVFAVEGDHRQSLSEIPLRIERNEDPP